MLRRVALVRADVSEKLGASFIRVTRISELETTLAVTSSVPSSPIIAPWWRRRYVPPKRQFLQEPHGVTSQKTSFFIFEVIWEISHDMFRPRRPSSCANKFYYFNETAVPQLFNYYFTFLILVCVVWMVIYSCLVCVCNSICKSTWCTDMIGDSYGADYPR
jgi:hypothetical protein